MTGHLHQHHLDTTSTHIINTLHTVSQSPAAELISLDR